MKPNELVAVDYFAGAGGWSTGAAAAGVRVAAAVNHWPRAVETHSKNHPDTKHICQDAGLIDPRDLPRHNLFLASPACQGHSRARGKERPHHDTSRATAWVVVDTLAVTRVPLFAVENVVEFLKWSLYPIWREALIKLGYKLVENILDSSEFGVPQARKRLFVTGTLDHRIYPAIRSPKLPKIGASSFLNWSAGNWKPWRDRVLPTRKRIAAGRERYGDRFLISYYGSSNGGHDPERPIGTITTRDRYALVRGNEMRMLSIPEARAAMSFPPHYVLTGDAKEKMMQLGNAVCPLVARHVVEQLAASAA